MHTYHELFSYFASGDFGDGRPSDVGDDTTCPLQESQCFCIQHASDNTFLGMSPVQHDYDILLILFDVPYRASDAVASRISRDCNPMRQDGRLTVPQRDDPIK